MRIGITGPIADGNLGDYGMLVNNIYEMGINNEYLIYSYNPKISQWVNKEYLKNFKTSIVSILLVPNENNTKKRSFRQYFKRLFLKLLGINKKYLFTPFEIIKKAKNIDSITDSISSIDILVVNGGGCFNKLWYTWHRRNDFFSIVIPIIIANQLNKKIVFTGNSFGPFGDTKGFFELLFCDLKNVHFGIRDNLLSRTTLSSIGISKNKISWIPDDFFFLNQNLKKISNPVPFKKYIVLELYQNIESIENIIKEFVDFLYEEFNICTVFIPFQEGKGGEEQGKILQSKINAKYFYLHHLNNRPLKIAEAYSIISNSEMVISNRYHAFLIALANQVPAISILKNVSGDKRYYYNKNYGLIREIFEGIPIRILDFLNDDIIGVFIKLKSSFQDIIQSQKEIYSSDIYKNNLENHLRIRNDYFKKRILD
ncbi:polysaccharide pyruvyl transferase family protein [Promethearchaeum syntrophicum]|uniref:Polysaccharide pyruvyl transferase family protein n=1 Tax=Promethearchaeum syntrophicum TaxID=2594042 RepID=A0A5B9DAM4_9ARCH|nr:polysaccharide pyruvyl transferase family protein [Candidatus Prometheoarchaeum syntrophicum]QEE16061.1 Polysaccharide pyruvyl transferase [Candidatus Prometheoarchaeum syntrophicum]